MITDRTPQVDAYLERLAINRPPHHAELRILREHLEQHRHGSAFPEVVFRIQRSGHYPLMGELRASDPLPPYRILFIMDPAETHLLYLFAGNKGAGPYQGNAWYDAWVPVADAFIDKYWTE